MTFLLSLPRTHGGSLLPAVPAGRTDRQPLEGIIDVQGGFRRTEQEVSVGSEHVADAPQHLPLGRRVEIDHDVAHQDEVQDGKVRPRSHEALPLEPDHRTDPSVELPSHAEPVEVLDQEVGRQAAVDLDLPVQARPGPIEHRGGHIRPDDRDLTIVQFAEVLADQHRQAVGLLAAGATGRPDEERSRQALALDQVRQHVGAETLERSHVSEPGRLVGGQRVDDLLVQRGRLFLTEGCYEFGERTQAGAANERIQPGDGEVLLPGLEHDRGALTHQVLDVPEVLFGEHHGPTPTGRWSGAVARPTSSRRSISAASPVSGTMASAIPDCTTNPGIPQTTLDASSCTMTRAPVSYS